MKPNPMLEKAIAGAVFGPNKDSVAKIGESQPAQKLSPRTAPIAIVQPSVTKHFAASNVSTPAATAINTLRTSMPVKPNSMKPQIAAPCLDGRSANFKREIEATNTHKKLVAKRMWDGSSQIRAEFSSLEIFETYLMKTTRWAS